LTLASGDLARRKVDRLYCLGDLVGYAPFPNEAVVRIRTDGTSTIIGNYDDGPGLIAMSAAARIANPKISDVGIVQCPHHRVEYDLKTVTAAMRQSDPSDTFAADLETGGARRSRLSWT
jgi:hypothetical protein